MHDIVKNCIIVYCESLWWSCDEVFVEVCNEWSITNSPIVNVCAEVLIKKCIIVCWNECLLGRFSKIFVECLWWIIHHSICCEECCEECFVRVRWRCDEEMLRNEVVKSLLKCVLEVVVMKWSCGKVVAVRLW